MADDHFLPELHKHAFRLRWRKGLEIQATGWGIAGTVAIAIFALTLYLFVFVHRS